MPDVGIVTATLQIRNSLDLTLLNNKTNRRLGCQFVDMSRSMLAHVQRYITTPGTRTQRPHRRPELITEPKLVTCLYTCIFMIS